MENAIPWDTWVVNQGWKGLRGRWMILDGRTEEGLLHGREGGGDRDGVDGRLLPRSKPTHSPRHPRPGPLTRTSAWRIDPADGWGGNCGRVSGSEVRGISLSSLCGDMQKEAIGLCFSG